MIQPTLNNLHANEYSQEFHYYLFAVKLDRCVKSCITLNDSSNKVCIPNKTIFKSKRFQHITGKNESKTLTKDISCECKCKFDGTKCKWWNNNKCQHEYKKIHVCEKDYVWNPATCNCENGKYLASIMEDSTITCNEVIESYDEEIKIIPRNFNEKKVVCKSFYILLAFVLIIIALLTAVSI